MVVCFISVCILSSTASRDRSVRFCRNESVNRMCSVEHDDCTVCVTCRCNECDFSSHCDACKEWFNEKINNFVKYGSCKRLIDCVDN